MTHKIIATLSMACLFGACANHDTSISALCEKGEKGSYVLKWEIYPEVDNATMEIFASDNDSVFPAHPTMRVDASKFIAIIEDADSLSYSFFKLKVGNTCSDVITNRVHKFDSVQNFRDLGGYRTSDGRMVKWGKLYRSGEYSAMSNSDAVQIKKLGIKSVIDFRSKRSQQYRKDLIDVPNRYELYIDGTTNDSISEQVLGNRFLRGDAIIYMQDMYQHMFMVQSNQFAHFFNYLTDESNYPIVFHCSLGKDQSGVAAYFLLKALDVPTDIIEDDYMLSNMEVDESKIIKDVTKMSESQQQAFTMLARTDASYLRYGLACAKKDGSIDDFMVNKLGLTKERREKLREKLLY